MDKSASSMAIGKMPPMPVSGGSKPLRHTRTKSLVEPGEFLKHVQKQLVKHANATSSQFLLIVCDAKGNLEMSTTSAFQAYRDRWITDEAKQDAKLIAVSTANEKKVRRKRESVDKKARRPEQSHSVDEEDEDWDEEHGRGMSHEERMLRAQAQHQKDMEMHMKKRPSQDDSGTSRKKKSVPRAELPTERRGSSGSDDIAEGISSEDYQPLIIGDRAAVTTFYMTRLRQMQQLMCKVVAKAWIKVVEPKKQSNFPYNRGEESKPAWWPRDVRHKEPDHLMKPERLTLLLTMLRSRKVPIDKLEAATSEVMVQIPKERIPLLNEIYQVARQEERFERSELPPSTIVYVAASEKIIRSPPAKEQSPQMRRPSIASPIGTSSAGSMQDRRMSVQSDMVNLSDGRDMDMRVPSRMGSRDDSASMHSQPGHNPYAGSGASGGVDSALGYTANYVAQSSITTASPLPEQPFIEMRSADYFMMVRRNPSALPPPTANSVHTSWPAPPMMYPFSPGSSSGHSSFNMPRQSASNPQTPVGGGQFQGHQQAQLGNRPSNMGGEGGGDQYDASNPMGPATHTNSLGFTEFLHRDLPGEDGNGRTKME